MKGGDRFGMAGMQVVCGVLARDETVKDTPGYKRPLPEALPKPLTPQITKCLSCHKGNTGPVTTDRLKKN